MGHDLIGIQFGKALDISRILHNLEWMIQSGNVLIEAKNNNFITPIYLKSAKFKLT
jgi:hypothetical protein